MVICTFFLNNNCRYGSNCKFDHIDIGQIVKSDIDSSIKGNQWLLSCYGPFKDSQNIPNYIEDQSFEEIRAQCYESKTNGTFPIFDQNYRQNINDAKTKLNQLFQMDTNAWTILIDLYNSAAAQKSKTLSTTNNPFTGSATATQQQTTTTTGNVFGNNNSIFGANNQNLPTINFGGQQQQQQPQESATLFGNSSFSLSQIGNPTTTTSTIQQNTNMFGNTGQLSSQAATGSGIFGNSDTTGNLFGNANFNQQQQQQQSQSQQSFGISNQNNIFGGNSAVINNNLTPSLSQNSIFGNAAVTAPQPQTNIFGAQSQLPSLFQQNAFGSSNVSTSSTPQTNNVFGSSGGQPTSQPTLFNNNSNDTNNTVSVEQHTANIFGSTNFQNNQQQSSEQQQNVLINSNSGNVNTEQQQQQQQPQQQQAPVIQFIESYYTKIEDLSQKDLDSFKADTFEIGNIPTVPPPFELCR